VQVIDSVSDGCLDSEPWQVTVEPTGGVSPPGCSRLSEILDQDLAGSDDRRLSGASKLVLHVRCQLQRKTHHVQAVTGVVPLLPAKFHRACCEVDEASGGARSACGREYETAGGRHHQRARPPSAAVRFRAITRSARRPATLSLSTSS
jgi:hypothetical protein